jgi:hypothetical protein
MRNLVVPKKNARKGYYTGPREKSNDDIQKKHAD